MEGGRGEGWREGRWMEGEKMDGGREEREGWREGRGMEGEKREREGGEGGMEGGKRDGGREEGWREGRWMEREDEGGGSGTGPRRYASSCALTSFSLCGLVVVPSLCVLLVVLSSLALCCHVAAGDVAPGFGWASVRARSVVSWWSRCPL